MTASVLIKDAQDNPARVDRGSGALAHIGLVHLQIHDGIVYHSDLVDLTLASLDTLELLVRSPAAGRMHVSFVARAGADARLQVFEGTTFSDPGSAVPARNRDRESSRQATMSVTAAPTVTADGVALLDTVIAGGTGGNTPGGDLENFSEWLLGRDSAHLIRLTNLANQAQPAALSIEWYESEE